MLCARFFRFFSGGGGSCIFWWWYREVDSPVKGPGLRAENFSVRSKQGTGSMFCRAVRRVTFEGRGMWSKGDTSTYVSDKRGRKIAVKKRGHKSINTRWWVHPLGRRTRSRVSCGTPLARGSGWPFTLGRTSQRSMPKLSTSSRGRVALPSRVCLEWFGMSTGSQCLHISTTPLCLKRGWVYPLSYLDFCF